MKVFVSNRLEILIQKLKGELFYTERDPLAKRFMLVPHATLHQELMLRLAQDPEVQVAAGLHLLTWAEIFPSIPSPLELSLKLEQKIEIEPLIPYLNQGGPLRKSGLAEKLSALFFHYLLLPEEQIEAWLDKGGWQPLLWKEVIGTELSYKPLQGTIFLFHPYHLSPLQLRALRAMNVTAFLFSPCAMYWGDFKTSRQKQFVLQKAKGSVRQDLEASFMQDHPLLANWGRQGRELLKLFEDDLLIEDYEGREGNTVLSTVQEEILTLQVLEKIPDASIQIHAAPSRLREVEVVWEMIQRLPFEPKEILVFVPQMESYAPLIEMIFRQKKGSYDFAIFSLEARAKNPCMQAVADLIDVARYRFAKERVEKLLTSPLFLQKFGFDQDEAVLICEWISKAHIRYDLKSDHPCSWEAGTRRCLEALVLPPQEDRLVLDFSEADLLSRWIHVIQLLTEMLGGIEATLSLREWVQKVRSWVETFFALEPGNDFLEQLRKIERLSVEGLFPFSTIERILNTLFDQKTGSIQSSHLQAVKFTSLQKGALMPAKAIILMGMDEGSFPRADSPSSLEELPICPRSSEERYLFLEALCHAREQLIIIYPYLHSEDGKHQKPSLLVQELQNYLKLETQQHYFTPLQPISSCEPKNLDPLPPSYDISWLRSLARHPLRFFLEKRVGLDFGRKEEASEFVVSPLELARLRAKVLKHPVDFLLEEMKNAGKLPLGPFAEVAIKRLRAEADEYLAIIEKGGIVPHEIYAVELKAGCQKPLRLDEETWVYPALNLKLSTGRECLIQGRIENLSPQGLLFHGDETPADLLKVWPLYLIATHLFPNLPLFLTKRGKVRTKSPSQDALERYLLYAEKAFNSPSPLFPAWARAIFKEGKVPRMQEEDPILTWADERNLLCPQETWIEMWKPYLQEAFREFL